MKKILIVENESMVVAIYKYILKDQGFELFFASDGNEGVDSIGEVMPDLLILDVMMKYRTGIEIAAYAKEKFADIPIIMVSALGNEETTVKALKDLGIVNLIAKPFDAESLLAKINEVLGDANVKK